MGAMEPHLIISSKKHIEFYFEGSSEIPHRKHELPPQPRPHPVGTLPLLC